MMDVFEAAIDLIRDNQYAWPQDKRATGYKRHSLADRCIGAYRTEQPRGRLRDGRSLWRESRELAGRRERRRCAIRGCNGFLYRPHRLQREMELGETGG